MNSVPTISTIKEAQAYRQQQEARDPLGWFILQAPDGSQTGDVHEMRTSEAQRRNEGRMALFLCSEQRRKDARKEWLAKQEENSRLNKIVQFSQAEVAERTRAAEVPIPGQSSELVRELIANRKQNPAPAEASIFSSSPEPPISYNSADYLWTRCHDARGKVVRVESVRRGRHD